jgi:hypothetical protein
MKPKTRSVRRPAVKRALAAACSAIVAIALGVSLEWVLLTGSTPQEIYRASLPPPPQEVRVHLAPAFQTGVIFPQWGTSAYSNSNSNWTYGLGEINDQTAAGWVEMPITLYQEHFTDTALQPSEQTPTPESLAEGIQAAHAHGFHVFVVPFVTVRPPDNNPDGHWSGDLGHYDPSIGSYRVVTTSRWRKAWFDGYWQAIEPYLQAAADAGAEQFAIGTEFEYLEYAPDTLWNTLIARAHSIYPGLLTYDMNWTAVLCVTGAGFAGRCASGVQEVHAWQKNPLLAYIGVSEYRPLYTRPAPLGGDVLPLIWGLKIGQDLDILSDVLGKPVLLSEIGYRNSMDALYTPWVWKTASPPDPELQKAAYDAALSNVTHDPRIAGIYFWGWSVPQFQPNWQPAAQMLHFWYTQPRLAQQDATFGSTGRSARSGG